MGASIDSVLRHPGEITYSLVGWELVPARPVRGETWEAAQHPASDFRRAINSIDPRSAAITCWIYPDSFATFRQLEEWLHQLGFTVAARPLPEGMAIRGSPGGSMSAGQ